MEPAKQGKAARNGRRRRKADLAAVLRKSWYHPRLSVRHPARVPTWDAVVMTAASPEQARLYEWQLGRAKRMGRIAAATAVPDPDGQHIGSGAATLNAVRALAELYRKLGVGIAPGVAPILTSFAFDQNLEQVHDKFNIRHDNLFLTVNFIDRFLAQQSLVRMKLQLVRSVGHAIGMHV